MLKLNNQEANSITFNNDNVYLVKYNGNSVWQKPVITLSPTSHTFSSLVVGYDEVLPKSITISNISTFPTGNITVTRSNTNFQLNSGSNNSITLPSIAANGSSSFTLRPTTELTVGTYKSTITVTAANGYSTTIDVNIKVDAAVYSFDVSYLSFNSYQVNYGSPSAVTMTIRNTGNKPTGSITISRSPTSFSLNKTSISSLAAGESATFTITPPTGLGVGSHSVSVTVSSANCDSVTRDGTMTVHNNWETIWTGSKTVYSEYDSVTGQCRTESFSVPGLESNNDVQISGYVQFVSVIDWQVENEYNQNFIDEFVPKTFYMEDAFVSIHNEGSTLYINFMPGVYILKGHVSGLMPNYVNITKVRRRS